jgi:lysophospholipase L1-like esterase
MRTRIFSTVVAIALLASAQAQDRRGGEHWVGTWGTAQQLAPEIRPPWVQPPPRAASDPPPPSPIPPIPESFADETVRMMVRASVGGERVRLTLSNALGAATVRIGAVHVALRNQGSTIVTGSDRAVTFGGRASFAIEPGALVVSDPVELAVPALAELAISLYLPEPTPTVTTHQLGLNTSYVARGNVAAAPMLADTATNLSYFWLTGVEVLASANVGAIVAFGDSITDGFSTTPDEHRAWPALLAAKLNGGRRGRGWGVVNAGIAGNRVRRDLVGASAHARFDRDVLARAGVAWVLLFEGINDLNFSALPGVPANQSTTAEQLIEALSQLVDRAHAHGIKVMGGTLMPMGGLWLHNADTEAMRQAVNNWIRTGGAFDAVADFDVVTRDPTDPTRLRPEFDSGDHIHPNDAGNAAMADAIDASVFAR